MQNKSEPAWLQFERGIDEVAYLNDVDSIRMLEARLAAAYWKLRSCNLLTLPGLLPKLDIYTLKRMAATC